MANGSDTTRIIIDLESRLRNIERHTRDLTKFKKLLESIANVKVNTQTSNRAADSARRLAQQQQRLAVQSQELANRQERARQTTERLALSQRRLEQAQQRVSAATTATARSAISLDQTLGRVGGSLRNLGLGLTSLGASISIALSAPLAALGVLASRNAVTLDSLQRGLTAITGSASEAGRQLTRLTEIAKLPGIGFQEAIQGSIRLQAVGFSAEVAERALVQFSNAVALTGGGREELSRITVQLGQLSAKGKVLAQDLKPIIEAGPAVGRALLQAFGTVNSEDIQALGLSSQQFIDTLIKQLEQLPRAAAGLRNTFDNFSDAVFRASAAIGNAILPVLTRLIEVAEPIITRLADGFAKLPAPIQTLVVTFGALAAAAGPALFILGQFSTGVGGLISALARLHALGLIPTIAGFRLLTQVMAGSASLAAGQVATTAAAAAGWGALGIAILGVIAVAGGIALLLNRQKDAIKISKEQIAVTDTQIASLKDQLKFLNGLTEGVEHTSIEQDRLAQTYAELNTQAKIRLTAISDEEKRLAALREELKQLLILREAERVQQTANLAASLANTAAQIDANQKSRDSIADRVRINTELAQSIRESGKVTVEQSRQLERLGLSGAATAQQAIFDLNRENERLIGNQTDLIKSSKELNGTAEEQAAALRALGVQNLEQARQMLSLAKSMGVFKGNVDEALPSIERYIKLQREAASANEEFRKSLDKAGDDLLKAGEKGETAARRRKSIIEAAATIARETSVDLRGAIKSLEQEVAAIPELRAALQRESELTGKSVEQIATEALTKGLDRGGTALRNAREQLAAALLETTQAQAESELATEKTKNERLLDANELSYRLQLRSYREYLEARASFTDANLALESKSAAKSVETARRNEARLRQAAARPGVPETERIKRLAQAEKFNEEAIRAETRLAEIERQREQVAQDLKQAFAELSVQQLKDVRQLEIEYSELTGRIEDALNTATDEKFRESLADLAKTQDSLNKQLERATKARKADLVVEIAAALQLNQRQIEAINNIVRQERELNKLAAANEFVRRAKERQTELERELTFEVEFRGLKEEDAIARRLAGERKLADSLRVVRDLVQSQIDALNATGVQPPQALIDFIRDTNDAIRGLGELPFSEQFRLVEKEFNRINDERIRKIQDVERAVRNRTIAEIEGQILIRRINGEYAADLEAQLVLLKQIAEASGQEGLKRQAADAGEVVRDTRDEIASLSKQIESAGKDAAQSGFATFLTDVANRTKTAKDAFLDFIDSVAARINEVIADELSKQLFESIFGGAEGEAGGLLAKIRGVFGGGKIETGIEGAAHGVEAAEHAAAATALTTGAAAAGAALATAGATTGAALVTALATAATAFAAQVIAAGTAFAAAIGVSTGTQAIGGLGSLLGADTGLYPAVPGGMYRFVEGGYPEAVLTTDPRHASKQVSILRELITRTRGFYGQLRTPEFATGGIVSRETAEANLLSSINRASSLSPSLPASALETAASQQLMNLRILNQISPEVVGHAYLSSERGVRDVVNIISRNSNEIARRLPIGR